MVLSVPEFMEEAREDVEEAGPLAILRLRFGPKRDFSP
jgi:hypothetical protein